MMNIGGLDHQLFRGKTAFFYTIRGTSPYTGERKDTKREQMQSITYFQPLTKPKNKLIILKTRDS